MAGRVTQTQEQGAMTLFEFFVLWMYIEIGLSICFHFAVQANKRGPR